MPGLSFLNSVVRPPCSRSSAAILLSFPFPSSARFRGVLPSCSAGATAGFDDGRPCYLTNIPCW